MSTRSTGMKAAQANRLERATTAPPLVVLHVPGERRVELCNGGRQEGLVVARAHIQDLIDLLREIEVRWNHHFGPRMAAVRPPPVGFGGTIITQRVATGHVLYRRREAAASSASQRSRSSRTSRARIARERA